VAYFFLLNPEPKWLCVLNVGFMIYGQQNRFAMSY
jgi:hypothetical protein